jgi:glycosyltransferase involved in cell wall biosynthesis
MATYGRYDDVARFLLEIQKQEYKNFEIIIIDQNDRIDLSPLIDNYRQEYEIIYCKNQVKGLSINRNIGLELASGDIICFPDDGCYYTKDTLKDVCDIFVNNPGVDFITVSLQDFSKNIYQNNLQKKKKINSINFFEYSISPSIFLRKENIQNFKFDVDFGIGSFYGSGEDSDLIMYLLSRSCKGVYLPCLYIHHPAKKNIPDVNRLSKYAFGFGAIMKKGAMIYKNKFCILLWLKYIIRDLVKIIIRNEKAIVVAQMGNRIKGFLTYRRRIC